MKHLQTNLKNLYLIFVIFFVTTSVYSQTAPPKNAKEKTIIYSDYSITGYIAKKEFINWQKITITSLKTKKTIICGDYFANSSSAYVNGYWYRDSPNGTTITNGFFEISNSPNIGLTTKVKNADSLKITTNDVFSYKGFRNSYPIFLEKLSNNNYSLIVNYDNDKRRMESNEVTKLEITVDKDLVKEYGFYSIDDFIFYTSDVKQTFANGDVFVGKVNYTSRNENNLISYIRKEGKFTHPTGNNKEEELIKQTDGKYKYVVTYSDSTPNYPFSKLEIDVTQELIDKYGYWATSDYIYNTTKAKYTYKNGNVYSGKVINTTDSVLFTEGTLTYHTGELFKGDLSQDWYLGIPISGTMTFTDGTSEQGNWFSKYQLSSSDEFYVNQSSTPTYKRATALKLQNNRKCESLLQQAEDAKTNEDYTLALQCYETIQIQYPNYSNSNININQEIENTKSLQEEAEKMKWETVLVNDEFGSLSKCYIKSPRYETKGDLYFDESLRIIIYPSYYTKSSYPIIRFRSSLNSHAYYVNLAIKTKDGTIYRFNKMKTFNIYESITGNIQIENQDAKKILNIILNNNSLQVSISTTYIDAIGINKTISAVFNITTKNVQGLYKEAYNICKDN